MNAIVRTALASALLPAAAAFAANQPPVISNVRASQRADTKLVDIYYDASDADGDLLKVRVEISDNDGTTYSIPAFTLSGDVGEGVATGTDKHIVWDAGTDWDGEYSDKMRVKVIAIDAKGFPNMEWGNEIPPGGFLLGQDGGAEGSGPSRHVNIPWSYWLSKYEITAEQYCAFLNAALAVGYIKLKDTSEVRAASDIPLDMVAMDDVVLCQIGDAYNIRWNVNRFEPSSDGCSNLPAVVTWDGAIAFARFYGYDLPTEAEWEKAARGPDNDDADEHTCFPWGDTITDSYANITPQKSLRTVGYYDGNQTPVGPDTLNGYGLYDVVGNAVEWTLSSDSDAANILDYPQQESLTNALHMPYNASTKIVRGYRGEPLYYRKNAKTSSQLLLYLSGYYASGSIYSGAMIPNFTSTSDPIGFRVVRRDGTKSITAKTALKEDFNLWNLLESSSSSTVTNVVNGNEWVFSSASYGGVQIYSSGVGDSQCLYVSSSAKVHIPSTDQPLVSVRLKVKGQDNYYYYVSLHSVKEDGSESTATETINDNGVHQVHSLSLAPAANAVAYYLSFSNSSVLVDDIELITTTAE